MGYLRVESDTLQLVRFEQTAQTEVYRARCEVYTAGQRNTARVLVLSNHSLNGDNNCPPPIVEIMPVHTERWVSSIKRSVGWHWNVNASGVPWYQEEEGEIPHSMRSGVASQQLNRVCFFGDSQTRNNALWLFPECSALKTMWDACPQSKFHQTIYGSMFLAHRPSWSDKKKCPLVVLNFGQWDLSFLQDNMTTYENYEKEVASVFEAYVQVRDPSSLVWATTNPFPSPGIAKECRFLYNIEEYNVKALNLAKRFKISIWDTFSVLKHVYDRSYDNAHYKFPDALWPSLLDVVRKKGYR